jgi:enolase
MNSTEIVQVRGRQVWDSRGRPTVEAEVTVASGKSGRAIAPSGASKGTGEAVDLRDGNARLGGFGVTRAVSHVNGEIARALLGCDASCQAKVDQILIELEPSNGRLRCTGLRGAS